ncbi:unnamed protein product [Mycena citricolor]|uniref:Uncharacterized protein n=1 Tax=Mycena citricolor TaxID=2018698 RepID=A0AAD2HKA0_9AGAR|nr:unnamed protein product [Mycena citricolor]
MLSLLLPVLSLLPAVNALWNVSVDDTSPLITYAGIWERSSSHRASLDFGGTHTGTSDVRASATFKFTGVAVYYLAPLWPYAVDTVITFDGERSVVVNLTDPFASTTSVGGSESSLWDVRWSATGPRIASYS